MDDRPRLFRDETEVTARHTLVDAPHVRPLNDWVRGLRERLGPDAIVPWFDPGDGGVDATILWLLEAPGPKATRERGGSGFISCNNNDGTAENTWRTRAEAGVDRKQVVHWNVIPHYLGSPTKIRARTPEDSRAVGPLLVKLLALLPRLRSVVLGGLNAQRTFGDYAPELNGVTVITAPHPSPLNVNPRPGTRPALVEAWRAAASA